MFVEYAAHHRVTKWSLLLKNKQTKKPTGLQKCKQGLGELGLFLI